MQGHVMHIVENQNLQSDLKMFSFLGHPTANVLSQSVTKHLRLTLVFM